MSISDRTASIRTHLEDDYNALETLGVTVQDRNIENIKEMANQIYAKFPKTEYAEGSNITLENCLKGKLDFEDDKVGYGDTYQYSTNGYQLIDMNDITNKDGNGVYVTKNGNEITINGTATANTYLNYIFTTSFQFQSGDKLIVSQDNVAPSGSGGSILIRNSDNNTVINCPFTDSSKSVTFSSNMVINRIVFYMPNGASISNHTFKIMLERGDTAHSWEPYTNGASPNPSYSQPIEVVTGEQEVTVRGKNWFDGELELGSFNWETGVKEPNNINYRSKNFTPIFPNTEYTFSINGTSQKYVIYEYDSAKTHIGTTQLSTGTFTSKNNAYYINFRCFNADFTSDYANLKIQLETGSTATTYEPYITPITKQLSLGDRKVYEGDYLWRDENTGKKYQHHKMSEHTFTGQEEVGKSGNYYTINKNTYLYSFDLPNGTTDFKSNKYIAKTTTNNIGEARVGTTNMIFNFSNTTTDMDSFKASLSTTTLVAPLSTETDEELAGTLATQLEDIYNLMSNNGTTILEVSGDLPLILKVRSLKAN